MTFRCHLSASDYAKIVFANFLAANWLWFVLPLLFLIGLATVDARFLLVAAMALMAAVPMVMAIVFFNYMLTVETRYSIADKEVQVSEQGIALTFADAKMQPRLLPWTDFKAAYRKGACILIVMCVRRYQYFAIPLHAVPDQEKLTDLIAKQLSQTPKGNLSQ